MKNTAAIIFPVLMAVWAGIIIGVSLISTPVKFQAPSLPMKAGLEIGRYTFRFLGKVELCFLIAVVCVGAVVRLRWMTGVLLALVVIQIALQRFWLLPGLDRRVSNVLAGADPEFSMQHVVFAAMEAAKAALLIAGAVIQYLYLLE
jgi:hypothetical protein